MINDTEGYTSFEEYIEVDEIVWFEIVQPVFDCVLNYPYNL